MTVALATRVLYARSQVRQMPERLVGLVPFANETGNIAYSLAGGRGFGSPFVQETGPTAWLTPVYPAIVAGVFKIYGIRTAHAFYAMAALNILFSVAACVPIFWIGRSLGGVSTGAVAAWLWALLPTAIIIPYQWVWDTSLAALLVATLSWATIRVADSERWRDWIAYGLLWGFALMTNPSLSAALPFLAAWAAFKVCRGGPGVESSHPTMIFSGPTLLRGTIALLVLVVCCIPWTVRNYRAFHAWVPLRSTLPLQLWLGNNNLFDPNYSGPVEANATREDIRRYVRMGEIAFMSAKGVEAREFVATHRTLYVRLTWRRMVAFWTGTEHPWTQLWTTDSWLVRLVIVVNVLTFIGTVAGLAILALRWRRRWWVFAVLRTLPGETPEARAERTSNARTNWLRCPRQPWVLGAWVFAYPIVYYLTRTLLRYRNVIEPVIVVLAAVAITEAFRVENSGSGSEREP